MPSGTSHGHLLSPVNTNFFQRREFEQRGSRTYGPFQAGTKPPWLRPSLLSWQQEKQLLAALAPSQESGVTRGFCQAQTPPGALSKLDLAVGCWGALLEHWVLLSEWILIWFFFPSAFPGALAAPWWKC